MKRSLIINKVTWNVVPIDMAILTFMYKRCFASLYIKIDPLNFFEIHSISFLLF